MASGSDRRRGLLLTVGVIALAAAVALPAGASILRGFTVRELRAGSDAIVAGKVVGLRSVHDGRTIETVARVRLSDVYKGEPSRIVRVRFPGGMVQGQRLVVPGTPQVARGDRLLLFLYRSGGDWRPVGLFQGVWKLDLDDPGSALASDAGGASILRDGDATLAVDRNRRDIDQLVGGAR